MYFFLCKTSVFTKHRRAREVRELGEMVCFDACCNSADGLVELSSELPLESAPSSPRKHAYALELSRRLSVCPLAYS